MGANLFFWLVRGQVILSPRLVGILDFWNFFFKQNPSQLRVTARRLVVATTATG